MSKIFCMLRLKRIYDAPSPNDGLRVLVDRLWPRGITKERAAVDMWMKDVAPSPKLRKWFDHDPKKWAEFSKCYSAELKQQPELLGELRQKSKRNTVTLLYAAKDEQHSHAIVLKDALIQSSEAQEKKHQPAKERKSP